MVHRAAPFSLPGLGRRSGAATLGPAEFFTILIATALLPMAIVLLIHPWLLDALDRRADLHERDTFGYAVGALPVAGGFAYWGVTSVEAGGAAARAGLRRGDVIVGSGGSLLWAVREAAAGRRACVEVWNVDGRAAGSGIRSVCFDAKR